ncbi:hypothetical protein PROFUN_08791 [Planoprotostelium fungivorum]|uniref:tRNA (guanine-N(7)-)-methyltransferase n=1 Tax=Planoprotostelium fungivorum TaxID=1890364 RepID=A0A2P6MVR7_9EUKA|nr:hypothetical protein PROFUN_08791 [Planoprotostelium fungivorum]
MEENKPTEIHPTDNSNDAKPEKKRKIHAYHHIKAHSNPLADKNFEYPLNPAAKDWSNYFAGKFKSQHAKVEFADVGCGYGGLLVNLSTAFPDTISLGMEIRDKVVEYVADRIDTLREKEPGKYQNIAVEKSNAMKNLPNYFEKGQLSKIFFLFPDPHFKKSNHRRRIISKQLLAEYAYVLKSGGIAYTISDVEDLHQWMDNHFSQHPLFEKLTQEELDADPVVPLVYASSEEARKVDRVNGKKMIAVFRRK